MTIDNQLVIKAALLLGAAAACAWALSTLGVASWPLDPYQVAGLAVLLFVGKTMIAPDVEININQPEAYGEYLQHRDEADRHLAAQGGADVRDPHGVTSTGRGIGPELEE